MRREENRGKSTGSEDFLYGSRRAGGGCQGITRRRGLQSITGSAVRRVRHTQGPLPRAWVWVWAGYGQQRNRQGTHSGRWQDDGSADGLHWLERSSPKAKGRVCNCSSACNRDELCSPGRKRDGGVRGGGSSEQRTRTLTLTLTLPTDGEDVGRQGRRAGRWAAGGLQVVVTSGKKERDGIACGG